MYSMFFSFVFFWWGGGVAHSLSIGNWANVRRMANKVGIFGGWMDGVERKQISFWWFLICFECPDLLTFMICHGVWVGLFLIWLAVWSGFCWFTRLLTAGRFWETKSLDSLLGVFACCLCSLPRQRASASEADQSLVFGWWDLSEDLLSLHSTGGQCSCLIWLLEILVCVCLAFEPDKVVACFRAWKIENVSIKNLLQDYSSKKQGKNQKI